MYEGKSVCVQAACMHRTYAFSMHACMHVFMYYFPYTHARTHTFHVHRYDPSQPNALHFYNLDALYSVEYHGEDHVTNSVVVAYATAALAYCAHLLGRECKEVVDVGAARCYFSEGMRRLGANVTSVEGTTAGVNACRNRADPGTVRLVRGPFVISSWALCVWLLSAD